MVWSPRNLLRNRLFIAILPILFCLMFGAVSENGVSASGHDAQVQPAPPESSLTSVIVQLDDAPLAAYAGGIPGLKATGPRHTGSVKLDMRSAEASAYVQYLDRKMQAFQVALTSSISGAKVLYRYRTVFGGVSVVLPGDRLSDLAALPGVKNVFPDRSRKKDTDSSPAFISAPKLWGKVGNQEQAGEGIIIGVIDTGVWPEHPSFSDPDPEGAAYSAPPPQWTPGVPVCEAPTDGSSPLTCNNKLIAARKFLTAYKQMEGIGPDEFDSPRDSDGHGTHTASTAAGNRGVNASIFGVPFGVLSGIAPRARVAVYKALGINGGKDSDLVAAIDQAVADGVDVINYSIGPQEAHLVDPYLNADDRAFLDAYQAGVFVATSAGNDGPGPNTVNHLGGWTTTVAASTQARTFQGTLNLAGGRKKLKLTGTSVTDGITESKPVVLASDFGDELCLNPFPPGTFHGEIVVCKRGNNARVAKGYNVQQGGASGMILYNPVLQGTSPDNHFLPALHLEADAGSKLLAFLAQNPEVNGTLTGGKRSKATGDLMGSFSSRGGSGQTYGISKPDITGPGVQILAGHTPVPDDVAGGPDGELFQAMQGTSMSSPHVAGAAALIRQYHPDWTPGQVKSALMTTSTTKKLLKENGVTPSDPFDRGSGRLDLGKAGDPGITFDAPGADFLTHQADLWKVNYPSVYIPGMPARMTVKRTARSVLSKASKWTVTALSPSDLQITVPASVAIEAGGSATFDLVIDASSVPAGAVRHATVTLKSGSTVAVLPVTIVRAP